MAIYFQANCDDTSWLSNFDHAWFELEGKTWPTVEHYIQAQRFLDPAAQEEIRLCPTAKEARRLGHTAKWTRRPDWHDLRADFARQALVAKFTEHANLSQLLLATGQEDLVESSPNDYFWGCGAKRTGQNILGQLLMELRQQLTAAASSA